MNKFRNKTPRDYLAAVRKKLIEWLAGKDISVAINIGVAGHLIIRGGAEGYGIIKDIHVSGPGFGCAVYATPSVAAEAEKRGRLLRRQMFPLSPPASFATQQQAAAWAEKTIQLVEERSLAALRKELGAYAAVLYPDLRPDHTRD